MKQTPIRIRAGDLKPAVAGLGKLASRKGTLPVLRHVKVETPKRDTLRFTSTDLDVTFSIEVPALLEKKAEPFLLPLERLRDLVRQTRAGDELSFGPLAKAPPIGEFPETTAFRAAPIPLPDSAASGLVHAFACASSDETRHILQGAFLDTSGKGAKAHRIVGTDGRHLFSSNSLHLPQMKAPVILPDHKLWQWKPLAESRPWTLSLGAEKDGTTPFRIEGPHWSVTGKTVEGNYPNYRQVIPGETRERLTIGREALLETVRRVSLLSSEKSNSVKIVLSEGNMDVTANSPDIGEAKESMPVNYSGAEMAIAFNPEFLMAPLRNLTDEEVQLDLIDEMSPGVLRAAGAFLYVLMPMRVTG